MIIKRIVEKLRNRGYEDFYLANLADKYDVVIFFVVLFFMAFFVMAIIAGLSLLLPDTFIKTLSREEIHPAFGILVVVIVILPNVLYAGIKDSRKKGEGDLRIIYIVSSILSKIMLKMTRYAPAISAFLLVVFLACAITQYGFDVKMLIAFALSLLLLFVFARPYHKLLAYVMKEAVYFVNWKTHQQLEHFEELYSRHDRWWMPSADLDFERFNIDHFRNICVSAFVSASVGSLAVLFYVLSYSPMLRIFRSEDVESYQEEQLYEEASYNEAEEDISDFLNAETDNVEKPEEVTATNEDDVIETGEDNANEVNYELKDVDEVEYKENAKKEDTERYHLSELDEQPTMKDGVAFKKGIADYLKKNIPEIGERLPYTEFGISPDGKITYVDASLISDKELRVKIENTLLSMPNLIPGRKNGHGVYVITNITIDETPY